MKAGAATVQSGPQNFPGLKRPRSRSWPTTKDRSRHRARPQPGGRRRSKRFAPASHTPLHECHLSPFQHRQPAGAGVFPNGRSDVAPYEGESLRGIDYPGLKPWAEFSGPFGTNTDVATDDARRAVVGEPRFSPYGDRTARECGPARLAYADP